MINQSNQITGIEFTEIEQIVADRAFQSHWLTALSVITSSCNKIRRNDDPLLI